MTSASAFALRTRSDWLPALQAICAPVLNHGAAATLRATMPDSLRSLRILLLMPLWPGWTSIAKLPIF